MNYFRLFEAVPKVHFSAFTGLNVSVADQALTSAIAQDLVSDQGDAWETTALGRRYLNSILDKLI